MKLSATMLNRVLERVEAIVGSNDVLSGDVVREIESLEVPIFLKKDVLKALRELLNPVETVRRGFFLAVTGIDKAGKETQCFNPEKVSGVKSVKDFLTELGGKVVSISLPSYETPLGSLVGAYLGVRGVNVEIEGEVLDEYAWILWSLDRAQYNGVVGKWLSCRKHFVLARRWTESNLCYQAARGVSEDRILRFERNIHKPDLTLVIDITAEEALRRASTMDRYERLDFLRKVRTKLLDIAFRGLVGRSVVVNGIGSPKDVNERLLRVLSYYIAEAKLI